MDAYTPRLLELGFRCMIGKGERSETVITAMKKAGAVLASCITSAEKAAFPGLGTKAVRRLTVHDYPAVVAIDSRGGDLYKLGSERYLNLS
jgi:fumarate hydratase subunit beta